MNIEERRTQRRATVQLLVGETRMGKYFLPLLADISESGLMLESPSGQDMPRAHAPWVEIALPGTPGLIRARCRLLRERNCGFFMRRALKFVNISAIDRQNIRLYVQRVCGVC